MEWRDRGIVLSARHHGEGGFVVDVLTEAHGRHGGLLRGAKAWRAALEPGSDVTLSWRARLADHLGAWTIEHARVRAALCLDDPARLAGLSAATLVTATLLPEREPHPNVHAALSVLLDAIVETDHWPALQVRYELGLLGDLGFGLDLARCAVTGGNEDLTHVSPRTGRAVSRAAAAPWAERLLPLPPFLIGVPGPVTNAQILEGFALTGHFLEAHAPQPARDRLIDARGRLIDRLKRTMLG